jgi:hypothetical protein
MFEESERPLQGLKKTYMTGFKQKIIQLYTGTYFFFTNFVIINLGLDPDQIRIQQQAGSGSGFRKIHGSGFGFS